MVAKIWFMDESGFTAMSVTGVSKLTFSSWPFGTCATGVWCSEAGSLPETCTISGKTCRYNNFYQDLIFIKIISKPQ